MKGQAFPWVMCMILLAALFLSRGQAGVAEAEKELADSLRAVAGDSVAVLERQRRAHEVRDSVELAVLGDSVEVYRSRADSLREVRDAAGARAEESRRAAAAAAETLEETLDSLQVPLFEAYVAKRDAVERSLETKVGSLAIELQDARAENVSLWEARRSSEDLYAAAVAEIELRTEELRHAQAAIDARDDIIRSQGRAKNTWKAVAFVGVLKAGYDYLRPGDDAP